MRLKRLKKRISKAINIVISKVTIGQKMLKKLYNKTKRKPSSPVTMPEQVDLTLGVWKTIEQDQVLFIHEEAKELLKNIEAGHNVLDTKITALTNTYLTVLLAASGAMGWLYQASNVACPFVLWAPLVIITVGLLAALSTLLMATKCQVGTGPGNDPASLLEHMDNPKLAYITEMANYQPRIVHAKKAAAKKGGLINRSLYIGILAILLGLVIFLGLLVAKGVVVIESGCALSAVELFDRFVDSGSV